ncbi:hypothetical protein [Geobacter sp. SVR]|uniref:hypothetical protein n=1 Tax=Geobacter sp. SVR TaxID=2495594 RepID=UPI00143EFC92|nr:hypothetical protein [Geobacter sp. SVR]BCS54555.1 hypothetical protein GSVR_28630 [Geobacter sp. SVR]GCF86938.1 hypothetical protein GSbR_35380 [Geobacter sp. SVR]
MATILDMVRNRLPDEAALFAASLPVVVEEAQALAGYEGIAEADLSTTRKSLIADLAAKALLLPARSHYKKEMNKVEGDGAGKAEFVDKLKFLAEMESALTRSIAERRQGIAPADTGVAMIVVE